MWCLEYQVQPAVHFQRGIKDVHVHKNVVAFLLEENEIIVLNARDTSSPLIYRETYRDFSGLAGKLVYFDQEINFTKP